MNHNITDLGIPAESELRGIGIIHADRHGALIIPSEVILDLKQAIETVIANEAIVLEPAREPGFDIKKLEEVWTKFEAQRT